MLTHELRRRKAQKDGSSYMTASSAEILVLGPGAPRSYWVCEAGEEIDAGPIHSPSQDPVEATNYGYVHTVEDQSAASAPLDLPLPGECLNPVPNDDSVLHNWWPDYDAFQEIEEGQASGLPAPLWPCTMNWYGDIRYQDDSNSAASIASPFIQVDDQLWDSRPDYDEEAVGTPWLPRDYCFSPSSDSTQSFRSPQVVARATSAKTPIQMKSIWPKPILPRPKKGDENRDMFSERNPRKGEPQLRRRSTSADCRDAFLVQSKLAGMSYKQIKEKGQFVEAESTLRGRFRTLTKNKEHRVRKPEWQERDIQLLGKAVQAVLSNTTNVSLAQHLTVPIANLTDLEHAIIILPLLSILSSLSLSLSLSLALPGNLAPRQLTPPALPYPAKFNKATCPARNGNLFNSNPFVKRTPTAPGPEADTTEISSCAVVENICTQIAGFTFSPVNGAMAHTYAVPVQKGLIYVVSVAADVVIQKIVAWAIIPRSRFGQSRFVAEVRPGQNAGTLQFFVSAATQVWFGVQFGQPHANGEIGLFSIGVDQ